MGGLQTYGARNGRVGDVWAALGLAISLLSILMVSLCRVARVQCIRLLSAQLLAMLLAGSGDPC
jgi:hypothetical protein